MVGRTQTGARSIALGALAAAVLVALGALGAGGALAQVAQPTGRWQAQPVAAEDGSFAYCLTENRYSNGQVLGIARNPTGEFIMLLGVPDGNLPEGKGARLRIKVDQRVDQQATGIFRNAETIEVPIGRNNALYEALMAGITLTVAGPSDQVQFALKGTRRALTDLRQCAERRGRGSRPAAARAGGGGGGGGGGRSGGGAGAAGLPGSVAQILAAARMGAVVPVQAADGSVAWGFGPIMGIVERETAPEGQSVARLGDTRLDKIEERCDGSFDRSPGRVESLANASVQTASAECRTGGNRIYLALLFVLTKTGNEFITFTHETNAEGKDAADRSRDRMLETIKALADRG